VLVGYFNVAKQKGNHKTVIHAQRLLYQVSGNVLYGSVYRLFAMCVNVGPVVFVPKIYHQTKKRCQRYPQCGPAQRLLCRDGMRATIEHTKVQRQQGENKDNKTNPEEHKRAIRDAKVLGYSQVMRARLYNF